MNQGKLDAVNQEVARMNTGILGINDIKWMEWVHLIQMTIYHCGQESLRKKWSNRHSQQKSEMQYLSAISKMAE